jgi:hypothetical protein
MSLPSIDVRTPIPFERDVQRDPGERDYISNLVREIGEAGGARKPTPEEVAHLRDFFSHRVLRTFVDAYIQAKYDEHVGRRLEWPDDTEPLDYLASLRETVLDPRSGLYLTNRHGTTDWALYFVGSVRRQWRGPYGSNRTAVLFNAERHSFVTGFQPLDDDDYIERRGGFWVHRS